MSSKLTELTESSLSAPPPSVLHGSGILSQFSSPSMASSGHFDPTQIYDSYKAVKALDPACTKCSAKKPCHQTGKQTSNVRRYLCSKKDGPFGKEFPVSEAPTLDGTSGYSASGHPSNSSHYQPPAKRFPSKVIPSTPRNFQPTLATIPTSIPPASPHSSHTRPAFNTAVRPSPIQQSRNSPIVNSQQLQPVASTSRRRDKLSPLPFPATQVFQRRD
ncbi:hypothetical protein O181_052191 [Austropuccinia psidii MF-1]|uniref:Uncharacterized protein n=1 Tax=Austropuccinia psidii MF-1 TaxID=1389203 RepID=A0A9Q3DXV6_9BASI|nr:hypothetical protein [Austropuccinia psidii MF-1]